MWAEPVQHISPTTVFNLHCKHDGETYDYTLGQYNKARCVPKTGKRNSPVPKVLPCAATKQLPPDSSGNHSPAFIHTSRYNNRSGSAKSMTSDTPPCGYIIDWESFYGISS